PDSWTSSPPDSLSAQQPSPRWRPRLPQPRIPFRAPLGRTRFDTPGTVTNPLLAQVLQHRLAHPTTLLRAGEDPLLQTRAQGLPRRREAELPRAQAPQPCRLAADLAHQVAPEQPAPALPGHHRGALATQLPQAEGDLQRADIEFHLPAGRVEGRHCRVAVLPAVPQARRHDQPSRPPAGATHVAHPFAYLQVPGQTLAVPIVQ